MTIGAISLLLIGCCLDHVLCTGTDFKSIGAGGSFVIGKKDSAPKVDVIVQPKSGDRQSNSAPKDEVNWCGKSDDKCPVNVCEQTGRVCCWCDGYCNWQPFGAIQPCFCCPKGHVCCSSTKPLWLKSPPTCCPENSECSPDGHSCLHRTKRVSAEVLTEICDASIFDDLSPKLPDKQDRVADTIW